MNGFGRSLKTVNITLPIDEIWYKSTDSGVVTPYAASAFGKTILSNTFSSLNNKGKIVFDGSISKIGTNAFSKKTTLYKINLPRYVTSLDSSCFMGCTNLFQVSSKSRNLTTIATKAFNGDTNLNYVNVDTSHLTSIGASAFTNTRIKEFTIPNTVTTLGNNAFTGAGYENSTIDIYCNIAAVSTNTTAPFYNSNVENLIFHEGVTSIGNYACQNALGTKYLKKIVFPSTLTTIGTSAFHGNSGLEYDVSIGSGVTVGKNSFRESGNANSYIRLYIDSSAGNNQSSSANGTFYLHKFSEIETGVNCPTVGNYAFYNNTSNNLQKIIFNEGLKTIGTYSFYYSNKLTSDLIIPSTVTAINQQAFTNAGNTDVNLRLNCNVQNYGADASSGFYKSIFNGIYINEGVTTIGNRAFNNTTATYVLLPSTLNVIGSYAFKGIAHHGDFTIPPDVSSLGLYSFQNFGDNTGDLYLNCNVPTAASGKEPLLNVKFNKLIVGEGVTSLGDRTLVNNVNVTEIELPSTLTNIGANAFASVTKVSDLHIKSTSCTFGTNAFYQFGTGTGTLTIDCDLHDSTSDTEIFEAAKFQNLVMSEGVQNIGSRSFISLTSLKNISLPTTLSSIKANAFNGCTGITDVSLNVAQDCSFGVTSFKSVGNGTGTLYINCNIHNNTSGSEIFNSAKFKKIILDSSCNYIGSRTFINHTSIQELDVQSENLSGIGAQAFSGCTALSNTVTLPSTLTTLDSSAFYNCGNGTGILNINCNIPSYTNANLAAFNAAKFKEVHIGEGVTTIGNYGVAFRNNSIKTLTLPSTLTTIGTYAFYNDSSIGSDVTIPASVTSIGAYSFQSCGSGAGNLYINCDVPAFASAAAGAFYTANFNSVIIGEGVTHLGNFAFASNTKIKKMSVPSTMETIDGSVFNGMTGLTEFKIYATIPPTLGTGAFASVTTNILVPAGRGDAYKEAWPTYASKIVEMNE